MKIKGMFKRSVAGLLLGVTLFTGYSTTYLQAREVKAMGTYTALYSIFEYVMASLGFAVTSKADNEALCDAFCDWFENYHGLRGATPSETAKNELDLLGKLYAGARVKLDDYPIIRDSMVKFIDQFLRKNTVNKAQSSDLLKDYGMAAPDNVGNRACFKPIVEGLGYDWTNCLAFSNCCYTYGYYLKKNSNFRDSNNSLYYGDVLICYFYFRRYNSQPIYKPYPLSSSEYLDSNYDIRRFSDGAKLCSLSAEVYIFDSDTKKLSNKFYYENAVKLPLAFQKYSQISCDIYPAEKNVDDVLSYAEISNSLKNIKGIYGNMDSISSSVANITEVIAGQTPLIDSIAQSIADMNSKTLTDEDINKIVEDALSNYKESIDSVKDNTEDTAQNTATTNSWLSKIYSKLNAISKSVSGNNALKLEDDVSSQFKVMEGGDSDPDDDNEPPKIRGIGAFTTVKLLQPVMEAYDISLKTITKWLSKINDTVAYSITQSTQQQIKAQEETTKAVNEVATKIQSLPEEIPLKMPENFPESIPLSIPETLPDLFPESIPLSIPETLPDLFPKSIPLELPENFPESIPLSIPETLPALFPESIPLTMPENFPQSIPLTMPDLEPSMDLYIGKLQDMVVPDLQPIEESLDKQKKDIEEKLPDLDNVFVFDKYSFDKEYPRIAITTPAIVSAAGYKSPEIVLFDGKDYVNYFVWIRMILDAIIRVGFAYALICKFRVRFTYS